MELYLPRVSRKYQKPEDSYGELVKKFAKNVKPLPSLKVSWKRHEHSFEEKKWIKVNPLQLKIDQFLLDRDGDLPLDTSKSFNSYSGSDKD